ncbi:MAG: WGR domain-containing protein [Deltaproteobacteria bacterium]|nr:WGR domain-containing protein [Deltaproteobacteria bacterium]
MKASKLWEIEIAGGGEQVVRFGRIGSNGQEKRKSFSSEEAAAREAQRLIEEKARKGYVER